jgi:hypothetical protein
MDWKHALNGAGFGDPHFDSYSYSRLSSPQAGGLEEKLDRSGTPIFQVIAARKRHCEL